MSKKLVKYILNTLPGPWLRRGSPSSPTKCTSSSWPRRPTAWRPRRRGRSAAGRRCRPRLRRRRSRSSFSWKILRLQLAIHSVWFRSCYCSDTSDPTFLAWSHFLATTSCGEQKITQPTTQNSYYFFTWNSKLQNFNSGTKRKHNHLTCWSPESEELSESIVGRP